MRRLRKFLLITFFLCLIAISIVLHYIGLKRDIVPWLHSDSKDIGYFDAIDIKRLVDDSKIKQESISSVRHNLSRETV